MHHDEQLESPTEMQELFNMSKHIDIAHHIEERREFILFQEIAKIIYIHFVFIKYEQSYI